jgi:23S rRNA (uracil1939-C5)-methyltransferase
MEIFPYTPRHPKGMRYVVLRKSSSTGAILVTLVATQRTGWLEDLANAIFRLPLNIQGVLIHVNTDPGNAIFVRDDAGRVRTSTLTGESLLPETVNGIQYWMSAGDFFQVNIAVAARLQRDVLEHARAFSDYPMIDLYCGAGFFTLPLAKEHGWAMGIELVNGAIQNAKRAALEQNINADFIVGDVFDEVDLVKRKIGDASPFLVVDPARRGLEVGVVEELDAMNPVAIAYVSCQPKSLARDLAAFQALGWTVEDSKVYDMFPHTVHLESLVLLKPPADRTLTGMTHRPKRVRLKAQVVEIQSQDVENPENDDSNG